MWKEFKEFIARGNVIDLAVAVIIGAAFGKIITSLVEGVIMPPIGLALGKADFSSLFIDLSGQHPLSLADAKAKGLPGRTVTFKHALRNALLPVVTNIGLEIPFLFTGAIVTETIFSWPGIGRLLIQSLGFRDYPLVQGCILLIAVTYVGVNLLTDLVYGILDPRIRYE